MENHVNGIIENIVVPNIKNCKKRMYNRGAYVAKFSTDGKFICCYRNINCAVNALCIELNNYNHKSVRSCITSVCNNYDRHITAYGYMWRYVHKNGEIINIDRNAKQG